MSDFKIYHAPVSYYSMMVRMAFADLEIEDVSYEKIDIHHEMAHLHPDYIKKNPNMTIPTVEHEGRFFTESKNVIEFLASEYADTEIVQTCTQELSEWLEAHYQQGIEYFTVSHLVKRYPFFKYAFAWRMEKGLQEIEKYRPDHPELNAAYTRKLGLLRWRQYHLHEKESFESSEEFMLALLRKMHTKLSDDRPYIMGDQYSLIDSLNTVFLARVMQVNGTLGTDRYLRKYWQRLKKREQFKQANILYKSPVKGFWAIWERPIKRISL